MRRSASARIVAVAAALLLLAGCSSDPLADQYREGSGKDYIAGDGTVETYSGASRGEPVSFGGETDDGSEFSSDDALGEVVVVNFWYAQCPPCRAEAADLQSLSDEFEPDGVQFVGVNTRDEAGTAQAFAKQFGVTYPSVLDYKEAGVQLAFSSSIPPNAVPTTLVLDRQGRVAARILGQVTEPTTLETIIRETAAETD
ncbi:TlpA family protein disulfide reductase [Amnibacterium flavum]|uniref:Alkyl hydroperoxide reductase n=1 Tax=Amnibacterium flavum TaxID=2173173 RepID=A0A2V1HYK3_9MICO|nr:TlpA disulfide reductase family protein [Amnibacterium flavum]PVZ95594.1 alkyl hydroperoxide reductase [Amnibacterium flavum]